MQKVYERIREKFPDLKLDISRKKMWYLSVPKEKIIEVADFFFNKLNCRFSTASAVDLPIGFEMIYHFCYDKNGLVISLKVLVSKENPTISSLTTLFPAAEWIEREIHELFGIEFIGLEKSRHLLLPENTPFTYNPLRRDFEG